MHQRLQTAVPNERDCVADQLDEITEQVWRDLKGRASRSRISQVAAEVAVNFRHATVTVFVPLFVRRTTRERLAEEIRREEVRV